MSFGLGVLELRPRDVAKRMFGGRGVGFECGGAFAAAAPR